MQPRKRGRIARKTNAKLNRETLDYCRIARQYKQLFSRITLVSISHTWIRELMKRGQSKAKRNGLRTPS